MQQTHKKKQKQHPKREMANMIVKVMLDIFSTSGSLSDEIFYYSITPE